MSPLVHSLILDHFLCPEQMYTFQPKTLYLAKFSQLNPVYWNTLGFCRVSWWLNRWLHRLSQGCQRTPFFPTVSDYQLILKCHTFHDPCGLTQSTWWTLPKKCTIWPWGLSLRIRVFRPQFFRRLSWDLLFCLNEAQKLRECWWLWQAWGLKPIFPQTRASWQSNHSFCRAAWRLSRTAWWWVLRACILGGYRWSSVWRIAFSVLLPFPTVDRRTWDINGTWSCLGLWSEVGFGASRLFQRRRYPEHPKSSDFRSCTLQVIFSQHSHCQ